MFKIKKKEGRAPTQEHPQEKTADLIVIAIPHMGTVPFHFALSLRNLLLPAPCIMRQVYSKPWDMARNKLVEEAFRAKASHIFFLDSDMIVPRDALARLLSRRLPVVAGNYTYGSFTIGRLSTGVVSVARNRRPDGHLDFIPLSDLKEGIYSYPNMVVGTGCLLIEMDVFSKLEKPYFKVTADDNGEMVEPEDYYFCKKCGEAGIPMALDCDIKCFHIKEGAFTCEGEFGSMSYGRQEG